MYMHLHTPKDIQIHTYIHASKQLMKEIKVNCSMSAERCIWRRGSTLERQQSMETSAKLTLELNQNQKQMYFPSNTTIPQWVNHKCPHFPSHPLKRYSNISTPINWKWNNITLTIKKSTAQFVRHFNKSKSTNTLKMCKITIPEV